MWGVGSGRVLCDRDARPRPDRGITIVSKVSKQNGTITNTATVATPTLQLLTTNDTSTVTVRF